MPPSRAEPRGRSSLIRDRPLLNGLSNPRSAQLESEKAKNYLKSPGIGMMPESRTPHHMKQKALEILIQNQNDQMSVLNLPKIYSTRANESNVGLVVPPSRLERLRRNENSDPSSGGSGLTPQIYMSKDLLTPK